MLYGKVVGSITATRKAEALSGYKFILIQPHVQLKEKSGAMSGAVFVAVDLLGAGIGEEVLVATGRAARIAMQKDDLPVDAAVIGIVDGAEY